MIVCPCGESKQVLVAIEDEVLRAQIVSVLSSLGGVEVVGVPSVDAVLAVLELHQVHFVVAELAGHGRSALELFEIHSGQALPVPVFLICNDPAGHCDPQLHAHAYVDIFHQPVELSELRELAKVRLETDCRLLSSPFSLVEYLQLGAMGGHSVLLEIYFAGRNVGRVLVYEGQVWAARDLHGLGEAAFRRLVLSQGVRVTCTTWMEAPGDRNLMGSHEYLLLEAMRLADEHAKDGHAYCCTPPPRRLSPTDSLPILPGSRASITSEQPAVSTSTAPVSTVPFVEWLDRGLGALLDREYDIAVQAFQQAQLIRPDDPQIFANLSRLEELGYGRET